MNLITTVYKQETIFKYIRRVGTLILFAILTFIFLIESPLHPWVGRDSYTDSSVFQCIGMMMHRGYMPYRDSFDHKGPVLYLLNYWGQSISSIRGVWVIEYIFMLVNFTFIYKIARLVTGRIQAILTLLTATALLGEYFTGGNLTEEYAMPMISISMYIFLDYFYNKKVSFLRLILCGVTFSIVLLLRPNMVSLWVVCCIAISLQCLCQSNGKEFSFFTFSFLLGAALVLIPILIWLIWNSSFTAFWADYIQFNLVYSQNTLANKIQVFFSFLQEPLLCISIILTVYFCKVDASHRRLWITYLCCFLLSTFTASMAAIDQGHYCMVLVPITAFPFAYLGKYCILSKKESFSVFAVLALLYSTLVVPTWAEFCSLTASNYNGRNSTNYSQTLRTIGSIVKEYTSANDTISVYGNWDMVYVYCERPHATKYSYQTAISRLAPDLFADYWKEMQEEQPKVIVVEANHLDYYIEQFTTENHYSLVWVQSEENPKAGACVYVKSSEDII